MPRPRAFDHDQVLDAAMQAFWSRGYVATSLADLLKATGLHKGSLYNAFGDKHQLFMTVLKRYLDEAFVSVREIVETASSPEAAIRSWFEYMHASDTGQPVRRGCFAVNTCVELGPYDADVLTLLKQHFNRMDQLLLGLIERAQTGGTFRTDRSPQALVSYLTTVSTGMMAASRTGLPGPDPQDLADLALDAMTP